MAAILNTRHGKRIPSPYVATSGGASILREASGTRMQKAVLEPRSSLSIIA